jgi:hypothetical protein
MIEAHPLTGIYFAGVFVTVGMATMNLILGVVVSVAQEAHDTLQGEMKDATKMAKLEVHNHLLQMCEQLDDDGSGELSKEEITRGYSEVPAFKKAFEDMDIEEQDIDMVWTILDTEKRGSVSYTDFVTDIYKLKDSDSEFLLAYIKYYITMIKHIMIEEMTKNKNEELEKLQLIEGQEEELLGMAGKTSEDLLGMAGKTLDPEKNKNLVQSASDGIDIPPKEQITVHGCSQTTPLPKMNDPHDAEYDHLMGDCRKLQKDLRDGMRDLSERADRSFNLLLERQRDPILSKALKDTPPRDIDASLTLEQKLAKAWVKPYANDERKRQVVCI